MLENIIPADRSLIIACDLRVQNLGNLVSKTAEIEEISAYKIGLEVVSGFGLEAAAEIIRSCSNKKLIWDYQKAGNDTKEQGEAFAILAAQAEMDAVIIFPQKEANPYEDWIKAASDFNVPVIFGAEMTYDKPIHEGGDVDQGSYSRMFDIAIDLGVRNFVVPGNKPDRVNFYRRYFSSQLNEDFALFAPGFVSQGGDISETGRVAGKKWHAIVGRAVINAANPKVAARKYSKQITNES